MLPRWACSHALAESASFTSYPVILVKGASQAYNHHTLKWYAIRHARLCSRARAGSSLASTAWCVRCACSLASWRAHSHSHYMRTCTVRWHHEHAVSLSFLPFSLLFSHSFLSFLFDGSTLAPHVSAVDTGSSRPLELLYAPPASAVPSLQRLTVTLDRDACRNLYQE